MTEEVAFRVLRRRGEGIGIRVAAETSPTDACYFLRDCDEVQESLQSLVEMLREKEQAVP